MAEHVSIEGAEKLAAVGKRLKETGDKELKKQLTAGLRKAAVPMVEAVRTSAGSLPHKGGLAELVGGAKVSVSNRLSGNSVGVRITAKLPGVDLGALERGKLRHPVFGNRKAWVTQTVPPGWFTAPLKQRVDAVRGALLQVIEDIAKEVEHG